MGGLRAVSSRASPAPRRARRAARGGRGGGGDLPRRLAASCVLPRSSAAGESTGLPGEWAYKVLGTPSGASSAEVQRAYRSRASQSPQDGFSAAALDSRQRVLEAAASLLCTPSSRYAYDRELAAARGGAEAELPLNMVPGALLALEEAGEVAAVLSAGARALEAVAPAEPMRADVLLAMALAECSLARRELESGRIPHGCERLSSALDLLESGRGVAPDLLDEIDRSLELLAPACALAHLGLPLGPEDEATRASAALTLAELLRIPRTGATAAAGRLPALNVKYVRSAFARLTPEEAAGLMEGGWWRTAEVMLGEGEALPASQSEALRLGATALLALGFYTRQPRLIADADVVLNDAMACAGAHVEIERTICAVLLGQPAAALHWADAALQADAEGRAGAALSSGSERALRAVTGAADAGGIDAALPGLCALVERWLADAALAPFRAAESPEELMQDEVLLAAAQPDASSLVAFFDDPAITEFCAASDYPPARRPMGLGGAITEAFRAIGGLMDGVLGGRSGDGRVVGQQLGRVLPQAPLLPQAAGLPEASSAALPPQAAPGGSVFDTAGVRDVEPSGQAEPPATAGEAAWDDGRDAAGTYDGQWSAEMPPEAAALPSPPAASFTPMAPPRPRRRWRMPLRVRQSIGAACIVASALLARSAWQVDARSRGTAPERTTRGVAPAAAPAEPSRAASRRPQGPRLDRRSAEATIRRWQDVKRQALGPKLQSGKLADALAEPALTQWQARVTDARENGYHWHYTLRSVRIESTPEPTADGSAWEVDVALDESAALVCPTDPSVEGSYSNVYTARYEIVRDVSSRSWKVRSTSVLSNQ